MSTVLLNWEKKLDAPRAGRAKMCIRDRPGVEAYKKNMFALLGKPGYEDLKARLETRL